MPFVKGKSGNPGGQWRPGQSGNPNGRPKTKPYKEALEKVAAAMGGYEELAKAQWAKALTGDVAAQKEIADRIDGKVPSPIGGTDELPAIKGFAWIEPEEETIKTESVEIEASKEIH